MGNKEDMLHLLYSAAKNPKVSITNQRTFSKSDMWELGIVNFYSKKEEDERDYPSYRIAPELSNGLWTRDDLHRLGNDFKINSARVSFLEKARHNESIVRKSVLLKTDDGEPNFLIKTVIERTYGEPQKFEFVQETDKTNELSWYQRNVLRMTYVTRQEEYFHTEKINYSKKYVMTFGDLVEEMSEKEVDEVIEELNRIKIGKSYEELERRLKKFETFSK